MLLLGILFAIFLLLIVISFFFLSMSYSSVAILFTNISVTASYLIGTGILKNLTKAFKLASHQIEEASAEDFRDSLGAIKTTMILILISGAIGILLGVVPLLSMYGDLKSIKPYIAFALISTLYALFGVLFLLPVKGRLASMLEKKNNSTDQL